MKRFIIISILMLIVAEWNYMYGQYMWVVRLKDGTEATYEIDNIKEMFVKGDEKYCNLPAKFIMENVYQVPALYIACNSMGAFCTITYSSNGKQFVFNEAGNTSNIDVSSIQNYSSFRLGLCGLIVGQSNTSEGSQVVCFDLACSNCYKEYNISKPLSIKDGTATCDSCKRTYDLNNSGIIKSGEEGIRLYRYRAKYENYSLYIDNTDYENSSYPPTWQGFIFINKGQEVNPRSGIFGGDEITVIAKQEKKGHNINATTYNWEVVMPVEQEDGTWENDTIEKSVQTNYDGYTDGSNDPSFTFLLPSKAAGVASVRFNAKYNYSRSGIQMEDGSNYDQSSAFGYIISTSDAAYGKANGSVRFTINIR